MGRTPFLVRFLSVYGALCLALTGYVFVTRDTVEFTDRSLYLPSIVWVLVGCALVALALPSLTPRYPRVHRPPEAPPHDPVA